MKISSLATLVGALTFASLASAQSHVEPQWSEWKWLDGVDYQIGGVNFTITGLSNYRSTLTGNASITFAVARRDHNATAWCTLDGWSAPNPPYGWVACDTSLPRPDLWFRFNQYSYTDIDLFIDLAELVAAPNLTLTSRTASVPLSTRSTNVADRLGCDGSMAEKYITCGLRGPVFQNNDGPKYLRPNTTRSAALPLRITSLLVDAPPVMRGDNPTCSVKAAISDPNVALLSNVSAPALADTSCSASWPCAASNASALHILTCDKRASTSHWQAQAALTTAANGAPSVELDFTHTFPATANFTAPGGWPFYTFREAQSVSGTVKAHATIPDREQTSGEARVESVEFNTCKGDGCY